MTLKEEILKAMETVPLIKADDGYSDDYKSYAAVAAKITIEKIEKAMKYAAMKALDKQVWTSEMQNEWLKENT